VCVDGRTGQINILGGILTLWATNLQHCSPLCSSCVLSPGSKFRGGHLERAEKKNSFPEKSVGLHQREGSMCVCVCVYLCVGRGGLWQGGFKQQWEEEICFSVSLFPLAETEPFIGGGPCHCFGCWHTMNRGFECGM